MTTQIPMIIRGVTRLQYDDIVTNDIIRGVTCLQYDDTGTNDNQRNDLSTV